MNALQQVWNHLSGAARVIFHDLFEEDDPDGPDRSDRGRLPAAIQAQMDALAAELTRLEARWQQAEAGRARAAAELAALDAAIDQALLAGDESGARSLVTRRLALAGPYQDLAQRSQAEARLVAEARALVERLGNRRDAARRQLAGLSAREEDAAALERLAALRRELDLALSGLGKEPQMDTDKHR